MSAMPRDGRSRLGSLGVDLQHFDPPLELQYRAEGR